MCVLSHSCTHPFHALTKLSHSFTIHALTGTIAVPLALRLTIHLLPSPSHALGPRPFPGSTVVETVSGLGGNS